MKRGDCSTMLNPAHLPAQQSNVVLPVPQHGSASSGLGETYVWAGATRLGYGVVESVSIHTYEAFRPDLLTARVNSKRAVCERPQEVRRIVPRISATKKSANAKMIRDGRSGKHRSRQEVAGLGHGVLSWNRRVSPPDIPSWVLISLRRNKLGSPARNAIFEKHNCPFYLTRSDDDTLNYHRLIA